MTITSKPLEIDGGEIEGVENDKAEVVFSKETTAQDIDQFAIRSYMKKCEQFHEDPKAFAAFILDISGNLHLISLACSPTGDTDRKKLSRKSAKNEIIHKNPLVLARRGLVRYLIKEVKSMETTEGESQILEKNEEGELQLKKGCHVYMYSTYSYVCENVYWGLEAMKR